MLHEIIVTQCADSALHALVAGITEFCRQVGLSIVSYHEEERLV
jgi:hypothetical protein